MRQESRSSRHFAALFRTVSASLRAALAVLREMLAALGGAQVARLSADLTDRRSQP
jgi:hypothetical protein